MTSKVQAVRGTQSMLGETADRFHAVVSAFDKVRRLYGFGRVEVPMFEATGVFARGMGETSDVVSKEMYTFEDRGGDSITLRPELTAGIARSYISEGWQQHAPLKVSTWGAAFRYERPQKGRFRQFHQLDAEILGAGEPLADVELLAFADQLLRELGISDGVTLKLNTLGDQATRDAWRAALVAHFEAHRGDLSEDSLARLAKNPLRILDSKDPRDRSAADSAPVIDDFLTGEASDFFASVIEGLDAAGVSWIRDPGLVRGLDYYRHTAFEFVTDRLGAQGTVLAGGRYDGLIEALGGPATSAVGWAAGIERLAMLIGGAITEELDVAVVPMSPEFDHHALAVLSALRADGWSADMSYKGNVKRRMQKAAERSARFAVFVGADSLTERRVQLRNMATGEQHPVVIDSLDNVLTEIGRFSAGLLLGTEDGVQRDIPPKSLSSVIDRS